MEYQPNDEELIYMIRENDEEAWKIIMNKYEPLLNYLAFYYQKNYTNQTSTDKEELIQEMRIAIYKSATSYQSQTNTKFFSYLFKSLKNACSVYCTKQAKNKYNEYLVEDTLKYEKPNDINNDTHKIYNDLYLDQKLLEFSLTLKTLDASIFLLKMSSFTYKEISKLLDINLKKVDNSIFRTKQKLRKFLQDTKEKS